LLRDKPIAEVRAHNDVRAAHSSPSLGSLMADQACARPAGQHPRARGCRRPAHCASPAESYSDVIIHVARGARGRYLDPNYKPSVISASILFRSDSGNSSNRSQRQADFQSCWPRKTAVCGTL
jgi:hypothetical protein